MFGRSNHLELSCGDKTIKSIFEQIVIVSDSQSELDQKVGGNEINGKLTAACEVRTGGQVLMKMNITQRMPYRETFTHGSVGRWGAIRLPDPIICILQ